METRAILRHSSIPPRKMRLIADLVRGKDVDVALHSLEFVTRAAAVPMRKLIQSAAANAREKAQTEERRLDVGQLYVKTVYVDEGPTMKRWRPRAQGRAYRIRKRSCHVHLVLGEYEDAVETTSAATDAATEAQPAQETRTAKPGKKEARGRAARSSGKEE
jgi:large subunit ribosomal protein L22